MPECRQSILTRGSRSELLRGGMLSWSEYACIVELTRFLCVGVRPVPRCYICFGHCVQKADICLRSESNDVMEGCPVLTACRETSNLHAGEKRLSSRVV